MKRPAPNLFTQLAADLGQPILTAKPAQNAELMPMPSLFDLEPEQEKEEEDDED